MLKYNSEAFNSSVKLMDVLSIHTKEELKSIAKFLEISIPTRLRKEEYVVAFAEYILTHPKEWLNLLTHYELTLLQRLVSVGPNSWVEELNSYVFNILERFSFIISDYSVIEEEKVRYMICEDLHKAVVPHIEEFLTSEKQTNRFMVEQYAYGIVNLYGLISLVEMRNMLNQYLHDLFRKEEIYEYLLSSTVVRRHSFEMSDAHNTIIYVQSSYLMDVEELKEEQNQRSDIKEVKLFSKEEVFLAGNMPSFDIPCACSDELKEYMLTRLGYGEEDINSLLISIWYNMQMETNPMSVITSLISHKLSSMQELQEAIELFMQYCNQCPRWFLKGYSPEEVSELFARDISRKAPHIVAGPNMKAAGMNITPEMQMQFNELYETTFEQKVGRNDPCPCGSGRKYKKCCGGN